MAGTTRHRWSWRCDPTSSTSAALVRNVPEHLADHRFVKWGGSVAFGWTSEDFEPPAAPGTLPLGVIGDPTRASAEHGLALWDDVVRDLGDALAEIAAFDPRAHHR